MISLKPRRNRWRKSREKKNKRSERDSHARHVHEEKKRKWQVLKLIYIVSGILYIHQCLAKN